MMGDPFDLKETGTHQCTISKYVKLCHLLTFSNTQQLC